MRKKTIIISALVLLSSVTLLSAKSLESLVVNSIEKSTQITNLELNKSYTMLSLEGSELESKTKVSVAPVSYTTTGLDSSSDTYNIYNFEGSSSGLVNIVIPGEVVPTSTNQVSDTTTVVLDGGLKFNPEATDVAIDPKLFAKASLTLSHNFLIGDYTNNLKDLNNQMTLLKAEQAYQRGVNSFKKNVYSSVKNIINNEKSQRDFVKKITDQEKTINDALKLNQISKQSISYKQYGLVLKTYKDTLENLKTQNESLLKNFKDYTGVDYVQVDQIREPNLELKDNINDSITVQLAKLNVKLKQNDIDQVEREKTQSYINVGTEIKKPYDIYAIKIDSGIIEKVNEDMSVGLQATYSADNFSLYAGTQVNIDFDEASAKPGFSVSGTWSNDTTNESDLINNKLNENALISAQLALNSTVQNQMLTKLNTNSLIINWRAQYNQLEDNIQFNLDNLELKKQMFDLGLATKSEIDDFTFAIEQLNYDKLTLLIDGLSIELDIQDMNL